MIVCPDCGHANIVGADTCEQCQQPLVAFDTQTLASDVERSLIEDPISVLKTNPAVTVAPDTRVGDVLKLLVDYSVGCVLVVDDDQLVGVFSERDALMHLNVEAAQLADQPVSKFMTASPTTLEVTHKIAFALHRMDLGGYRHIPILTDGKPSGILSIRNILAYLTAKAAAERDASA